MPIYEYRCTECNQVSELLVQIGRNSDDLVCSSCGGSKLEKLMSTSAPMKQSADYPKMGTCCGGSPSTQGCVPGSCCGSS